MLEEYEKFYSEENQLENNENEYIEQVVSIDSIPFL